MTTAAAAPNQLFDYISDFVKTESGIVIERGKEYLVESRLAPIARRENLGTVDALIRHLRTTAGTALRREVIDVMTTNETTFFRDVEPFEVLEKSVLPALIEARRATRTLRVWYAASSYGQEPYSVSMLMLDKFPELATWKIDQLATDISRPALTRAKAARFSQLEVNRGLPAKYLVKYFRKDGTDWQLDDRVRKMVRFDEMNLIGLWPPMGTVDIVFIRNVMIYFDTETKKKILGRIHKLLATDGYLFLGAAETTLNIDERFVRSEFGRGGCYKLAKP